MFLAITLLILFILCVVCCYSLYIYYVRSVKYGNFPRMNPDSFFWGHASLFAEEEKTGDYRAHTWLKWAENLGPTFCLFVIHRTFIVTCDPITIKELLSSSKYPKSSVSYKRTAQIFGHRFIGNGLVTNTDHESWTRRRAMFSPAFHKKSLMGLMQYFNDGADKFVTKIETLADGKSHVPLAEITARATLDIIGKVAFDIDINSLNDPNNPFPQMINLCLAGLTRQIKKPFFNYNPANRGAVKKILDALHSLRTFGKQCFEKRLKVIEENNEVPNDILSGIMNQFSHDPTLDMEDFADDFITFFIAGQETTANAVSFVLMLLADHPDVLERVMEELLSIIGDKQQLEYSDIGKLEYLDQVWKESLRLFPTAPGTVREIPEETEINGLVYPAKTNVLIHFYMAHRYPGNFSDPDEFQPERFNDGNKYTYSYLPFSLGLRSCLGSHFAWIEGKTIIAKFLKAFTYELIPGQDRRVSEATTLRPAGGVVCKIKNRH